MQKNLFFFSKLKSIHFWSKNISIIYQKIKLEIFFYLKKKKNNLKWKKYALYL
jgi:hypothetical protein